VGTGCGLDKANEPVLGGPADQGFNIDLVALPDTLNADGVSTSNVRLVVRDESGQAVNNHSVLFLHNGDGVLSPSTASTYVGPIQTGIVMATDSQGTVNVVYTAGTGIGIVTIAVRPYGIDAANGYSRSVDISQQ
jgi:hypothetical protein